MADFTGIDLFGEIYDADDANAVQQSQVVPTVDATSDDDHVPTAKAVWDAILAGLVPAFHVTEFELPAGCTDLYMEQKVSGATGAPYGVEVTASVSGDDIAVETDDNYPLNAIHISNLSEAPTWQNFKYDGLPAQWSDIDEMLVVSTPTDAYVYLKVAIYHSGGTDLYDYVRYRILYVEPYAAGDLPETKYVKVWDSLTLYPEVNTDGHIDKIVLNGTERDIEDPNAADQTLSNLTDASDARDNLGLGAAATKSVALGYAAASVAGDLVDISVLREANAYNNPGQYITGATHSVTGAALKRVTLTFNHEIEQGDDYTFTSSLTNITPIVIVGCAQCGAVGYVSGFEIQYAKSTGSFSVVNNTTSHINGDIYITVIYS